MSITRYARALAPIFAAALFAAPALAQTNAAPFYRAELAAPATAPRAIAGGVIWQCSGTTCTAAKGNSRPLVMCARLAREAGPITSFTAGGEALAAEQLARCNR